MIETPAAAPADRQSVFRAFVAVMTLFFAWGFLASLLDPLAAAVKAIFDLSNVDTQLSIFAFFLPYALMSLPAASLLSRFGALRAILTALATMVGGCITMLLAANVAIYAMLLAGLFLLSCGIVILQVAANPLAAALGDPARSHFRLTFSQAVNSLGTSVGPMVGAAWFLKGMETKDGSVNTAAARAASLAGIDAAYFWISALIALLALFFYLNRGLINRAAPLQGGARGPIAMLREALSARWTRLGGLAIFLYVGAEVGVVSQMGFFLNSDAIWGQSDAFFSMPLLSRVAVQDGVVGLSLEQAVSVVALYGLGAMVGRAIGSVMLVRLSAWRLLATFAVIAAGICVFVLLVGGVAAGFLALAIGLFNSIMFPVIFTLTLERSSASEAATSGFLCTAIVGGGVVPMLVARVADVSDYATAFVVPLLCYVAIGLFAIAAGRAPLRRNGMGA